MNTLTRLDTYVASFLYPFSSSSTSTPTRNSVSAGPPQEAGSSSLDASRPSHRLSNLPPTPRKPRRRRHKPTTSSIKLPPPSTPLLLRIVLALWSILLSLWTSLVVETRAERVKRRRKPRPNLLRQLSEAVVAAATDSVETEVEVSTEVEGEAEGSASEIDGALVSDDEWVDPVTRAPVDEKTDIPTDEEYSPALPPPTPLPLFSSSNTTRTEEKFSFRLRSAEGRALISPETPPPVPRTFVQQPTPPGILSNPLAARAAIEHKQPFVPEEEDVDVKPRISPRKSGLLPNPIATNVLDPTVPAVPSSKTFSIASGPSIPSPRKHTTPFHLQKTLILDLDETLIHSTSRPISYAASSGGGLLGLSGGLLGSRKTRREGHTVEVVLHGRSTTYHVYKRPHVDHFLKKVASWYTLVIFTASMPEYADPVIDWLDAGRGLFAKKLYRESCHLQPNGSYIKDLALVEADLSRVCFMDNSPISYSWNKANALPIEGWTSDPNDEALLHSIPVLDSLRFVNDVRRVLGIRGFS